MNFELVKTGIGLKKALCGALAVATAVTCVQVGVSTISTYLGNNVTSGNVTSGNVTNGNITGGNVTGGNVTGGNVTDGNVNNSDVTIGYLTFSLNPGDKSYCVSKCKTSARGEIVIPAVCDGKPVNRIGERAFEDCKNLKSVEIPDSVTSIADYSFFDCKNLKSINIPDKVTSIGNQAFSGCESLTSITIPDSVNSLGYSAFSECTGLESVTIPDAVKSLREMVFYKCTSLKSVTLPDSLTSIGLEAFQRCESLESITIPDSVTSIGWCAFNDCKSLTSIVIPDSVTEINGNAFSYCTNLTTITIPDSVVSIDESIVYNTAYYNNEDNWENGVLYIDNHLIAASHFDEETLEHIGKVEGAYVVKEGTITVAGAAFQNCNELTSVTIPDSVVNIGIYAFSDCKKLENVTISGGVEIIEYAAFANCESLASISIPDGTLHIGYYAFRNCKTLEKITIPDSVTSIREKAFYNTAYYNNKANWENGVLYIDNHLISAFHIDEEVGKYVGNVEGAYDIKEGTRTIAANAFIGNHKLTAITIPDSVTCIEYGAFRVCDSLENVIIPDGVTSLGGYVFGGCSSLTSVIIPDSVTHIDYGAFGNCSSLESVVIPDSLTEISDGMFMYCTNLKSIEIPDSVTSIGSEAFTGCENLTSVTIPESVKSMGMGAFSECTSLTSVVILDGVEHIYANAFRDCTSLASITIPDSVIYIEEYAFCRNGSLEYVFYSGSENDWAKIGFDKYNNSLDNAKIHYNSTDHAYGNLIIKESTCTKKGSKYYKCSICGYKNITETIPATGHNWVNDICINCDSYVFSYKIIGGEVTITGYNGNESKLVIPDTIEGLPVTNIGEFAFEYCQNIESIIIPYGVIEIERCAFYNCTNLKSIEIPCSVVSIEGGVFWWCSNLENVVIPDSVTSIDDFAFCNCVSLEEITIPDSVTYIGANVFYDTAYYNNEVNWKDGVLYIGDFVIEAKPSISESYTIKTGTKIIAGYAFNGAVLETVAIPESVTNICYYAFYGCPNLESIRIPDSVAIIEEKAFYNCTSLKSIAIPDSVTDIGDRAFGYYYSDSTGDVERVDGFKIYGKEGSAAQAYAVENGFEFIAIADEPDEPIQETENTQIDYDNMVIRTGVQSADDIIEILNVSENATVVAEASLKYGSVERLGTGSVISVYDGDKHIGDFTLVVEGDTTGDSVCDVLDCATVALVANGLKEFDGAYAMAADNNYDEVVDDADYQAIINKLLA